MSDTPEQITVAERYLTEPALDRRLPEHGRDPRTALEIVQSEMLLDGNPAKNLATFVTTWMEPEARQVIAENLHRNFIDHAEYPRTAEVARRCVRMIQPPASGCAAGAGTRPALERPSRWSPSGVAPA